MGGARVAFGFTKVDRRDSGGDKPKWYLEPVEPIHAEAKRMKAEGMSLRAAAEAFRAIGHDVSHAGVRSLFALI